MADTSPQTTQLQDLLAHPREQLDIEIKSWLDLAQPAHQADLAKALIAITNHGGGFVVLGLRQSANGWESDPQRPASLSGFTQDSVNGVVAGYAEPSFHCDVQCIEHPTTKEPFPIIIVPGIKGTPTRSKRDGPQDSKGKPIHVNINTYYIRRPGPKSEAPQTGQEWDQLIRRCVRTASDDLLSTIAGFFNATQGATTQSAPPTALLDNWFAEARTRQAELIAKPDERAVYKYGTWTCAYVLAKGVQPKPLGEFFRLLTAVAGHETGWPPWWVPTRREIAPYSKDDLVECWLRSTDGAAHADYWLASPHGKMYLIRGYQEDELKDRAAPGTALDVTIPAWRVGECLLHASRLSKAMGNSDTEVDFVFQWTGLSRRSLVSLSFERHVQTRHSRTDTVTGRLRVKANTISAATLPQLVADVTRPLYNAFEFLEPPMSLFVEEIEKMIGRSQRS